MSAKRRRRQRRAKPGKIKPITVDIETRGRLSAMELGTRMHREIERVLAGGNPFALGAWPYGAFHIVADSHIGVGDDVINAARLAPPDAYAVVHGGDYIQMRPVVGHQLFALDYKIAEEAFAAAVRAANLPLTKPEDIK